MRCSTALFTYEARRKVFTAECSDIAPVRDFNWTVFPMGRGLILHSAKTGVEIRYMVTYHQMDRSGEDITAYVLRPLNEDVERHPAARGTSIFLIND